MPRSRTELLNELHEEWRQHLADLEPGGTYVRDGIVDEGRFCGAAFVLKDSNYNGDLCELYSQPDRMGRSRVWYTIDRCTRGLLGTTPETILAWDAVVELDGSNATRAAHINLKKTLGGPSISPSVLWSTAWRDREFIRRQLEIVAPSVAVCGSTWKAMDAAGVFGESVLPVDDEDDLLRDCYQVGATLFIDYLHPSQRRMSARRYYERLMQTYQRLLADPPSGFRPLTA